MCLSTLYGVRNDKREKLGEYISNVTMRDGEYVFTDVLGNELTLKGRINSLDLIRNEIIIELEKRQRWVVAKKVLKPLLLIHLIYIKYCV